MTLPDLTTRTKYLLKAVEESSQRSPTTSANLYAGMQMVSQAINLPTSNSTQQPSAHCQSCGYAVPVTPSTRSAALKRRVRARKLTAARNGTAGSGDAIPTLHCSKCSRSTRSRGTASGDRPVEAASTTAHAAPRGSARVRASRSSHLGQGRIVEGREESVRSTKAEKPLVATEPSKLGLMDFLQKA